MSRARTVGPVDAPGPVGRVAGPTAREVVSRAFAVGVFSLVPAAAVSVLLVGGWGRMSTDLLDLVPVVAYPAAVAVLAVVAHRRLPSLLARGRWAFGVLTAAASLVSLAFVSAAVVVLAVVIGAVSGEPAPAAGDVAGLVALAVSAGLLTGLPLWSGLLGALLAPADAPHEG